MKKILSIALLSVTLAACSSLGMDNDSRVVIKKPTKEEMTKEASEKCQTLGFEVGTKEHRECTVKQFDKMQDKYY